MAQESKGAVPECSMYVAMTDALHLALEEGD
jgi:hypothetical protein